MLWEGGKQKAGGNFLLLWQEKAIKKQRKTDKEELDLEKEGKTVLMKGKKTNKGTIERRQKKIEEL